MLGKYCIENGKLDKSFGRMFAVAQEARYRADYKEKVKITEKDAKESIESAEKFIGKMMEVLGGR
ncbi:HEPN domain-containing protein [bacterium]|nr:HEPN domain-containing protein [bacterium]MCK4436823.1 HEPN domain-containing protein [bacterium]